ncbi:MAG: 50S ribosomal protein L11 methyltransferase [Candidatus Omnitrophica bacterium]|nr:50S ribosomal protein L11 methyltransferase [Candidatus Omnitrophota bacterium]MBU1995895.1 50S ribosomal protein L11 methyltransferase [Candidatus Omnitrophota bacterium]
MGRNLTYEISVSVARDNVAAIEILKGILCSIGVPEGDIVELENKKEKVLSFFLQYNNAAVIAVKRIRKLKMKNVRTKYKVLKKEDWLTKWKTDFKPFMLTKNFKVIPAWLKKQDDKFMSRKIYLDTDMAFGTGLHPTTRFMANLIERCSGKFESFVDIGTGTAILAIIAERCSATIIDAFDYDEDAVKTAQKNLVRNRTKLINLSVADITKTKARMKYDFVSANLITEDLIANRKKILSFVKPGKFLAVSGISVSSSEYFRNEFQEKLPLRCVKIEKDQGWFAFLYKRI